MFARFRPLPAAPAGLCEIIDGISPHICFWHMILLLIKLIILLYVVMKMILFLKETGRLRSL